MAKRSPTDTQEQAEQIIEAWKNIGNEHIFGELTLKDMKDSLDELEQMEMAIRNTQDRLTSLRNARLEKRRNLWDLVKRVRSVVKGQFGDDSDEYERFGGTRISERKPPRTTSDDQ